MRLFLHVSPVWARSGPSSCPCPLSGTMAMATLCSLPHSGSWPAGDCPVLLHTFSFWVTGHAPDPAVTAASTSPGDEVRIRLCCGRSFWNSLPLPEEPPLSLEFVFCSLHVAVGVWPRGEVPSWARAPLGVPVYVGIKSVMRW